MAEFKLYDSKFRVTNHQGDIFTVEVAEVREDFMLELNLIPLDADLEGEIWTVDLLNETVPQYLEYVGYSIHKDNKTGGA